MASRVPEAWDAYDKLWRVYLGFEPSTDHQRIWFEESLTRMNDLGDQRRLRLLASRAEGVPNVMWIVLLGAGAVTVSFTFLFGTMNPTGHLLMIIGLAATIALVLFSIFAMHEPFAGITRVRPEAFRQTLTLFDRQNRAEGEQAPAPGGG